MITYDEFQKALKIVNEYKTQLETHIKQVAKEMYSVGKFANVNKEMELQDTDCSVRLLNIIKANEYKFGIDGNQKTKVSELSKISMGEFLRCRGAGKGALQELKELCFCAGVSLQP